jgi:hypothetical protein
MAFCNGRRYGPSEGLERDQRVIGLAPSEPSHASVELNSNPAPYNLFHISSRFAGRTMTEFNGKPEIHSARKVSKCTSILFCQTFVFVSTYARMLFSK